MNKAALAAEIAARYHITKKSADEMIGMVFHTASDVLARGEKVTVYGFGTLEPVVRRARAGRRAGTGAPAPAHLQKTVVLRPGRDLSARLNRDEA